MSRRRLRDCVILEGVREEGALARQPAESSRELAGPPVEVIGAHLIDRDEDHELWPSGRSRRKWRCRRIPKERSGDHAGDKGNGSQKPALGHSIVSCW
jgi:hypothetical protein